MNSIKIKSLGLSLIVGLALLGCSSYDDTDVKNQIENLDGRVSQLESLVNQINTDISSYLSTVKALESGDRIVSVKPLDDGSGYTITFSNAGEIVIYNGATGHSPKIGVRQDTDGTYYWTVDSEYLLDGNGNKIAATAHIATPKVQLSSDGKHYEISFDNGATWLIVGDVVGTSGGDAIFKAVQDGDEAVTFTLTDGSTIVIPKAAKFSLNISKVNYVASAGGSIPINYTVSGADEGTIVNGFATNGYQTVFEASSYSMGVITVTEPSPVAEGQVFAFAIKSDGSTSGRIISFAEGILTVDDMLVPEEVPAVGGSVMLFITTNQEYTVEIQESALSWLSLVETKAAIRNETVMLQVAENTGSQRSAFVNIRNESREIAKTITIVQAGSDAGNTANGYVNNISDWERNFNLTF